MNKILLFFIFPTFLFSQSSKEFLINDNEKIMSKVNLSDVISESKNYGYNFVRDKNQNYIFKEMGFNYVILTKEIDPYNPEIFPNYSIGTIYKKYFFLNKEIDDKCIIWKIDTKIILNEHEYLSAIQIKNFFKEIKNNLDKNIDDRNWLIIENYKKINCKIWLEYFDVIEEKAIRKKSDFNDVFMDHFFLNGICFKNVTTSAGYELKRHYFYFSFKDKLTLETEKGFQDMEKIFLPSEDSRYKIGDKDLREINQFDLEAMVKFFIEDCKRINKNIPKINSLKATFETLDGEKIALAYGLGDDTSIIIKVDPVKWENSNIVKRWYIIYHELGHDVLNLEHGQGGKMMFSFADKEYSWEDFFNDKEYMINSIKDKDFTSQIETVKIENKEIVKIGTQEWMVKNLDVSTYRNGDIIPEVKDPKKWANLKTGAWSYYNNDPKNGKIYGKLYNWYAVNDQRGLAPEGFHIPSDSEWTILDAYLGNVAGGKIKEQGTIHWKNPNSDATNSSGFTALPGGHRFIDGKFDNIGIGAFFTISDYEKTNAWVRYLYNDDMGLLYRISTEFLNPSDRNKKAGVSVRCVKD